MDHVILEYSHYFHFAVLRSVRMDNTVDCNCQDKNVQSTVSTYTFQNKFQFH